MGLPKSLEKLSRKLKSLGGMTMAVETGILKTRIEESAVIKQARIDSGRDIVVGINAFQLQEEDALHILEVSNNEGRHQQIERLDGIKKYS